MKRRAATSSKARDCVISRAFKIIRKVLLVFAIPGLASGTTAQSLNASDRALAISAWRSLAETDLEAAHALIRDNHPGAVPELGDAEFRNRLREGHAQARARIAQVESYSGYRAVLLGFANSLGDKHIWSGARLSRRSFQFPGFVTALRGGRWVVAEEIWPTAEEPLTGAEIILCDGMPVSELARQRLGGFKAIWDVPAQRVAASPWLLVHDNPLMPRPKACVFRRDGAEIEHKLSWGGMDAPALQERMEAAVKSGKAGHGVRRFANGWWIGLQDLSPSAEAVVEEARTHAEDLRRAPIVVIDLRGNSGGNSLYGQQLAEILYGEAAVEAALSGEEDGSSCGAPWRASQGNLERVEQILSQRKGAAAQLLQQVRNAMAAALERGEPFSGSVACPHHSKAEPQPAAPDAEENPRMILLTDHVCFSSCLLVADYFRKLGALHVGESTDAATRYMEVRETILPSGISTFSTLQKVNLDAPPQIGPFVPERLFQGDISDTASLEAWIAAMAGS